MKRGLKMKFSFEIFLNEYNDYLYFKNSIVEIEKNSFVFQIHENNIKYKFSLFFEKNKFSLYLNVFDFSSGINISNMSLNKKIISERNLFLSSIAEKIELEILEFISERYKLFLLFNKLEFDNHSLKKIHSYACLRE